MDSPRSLRVVFETQLCYSVLHVSQDPIVGVGQQAKKFWDRVHDQYEKKKPKGAETRGKKSLEGKWADIKHDVAKFTGCFEQVESRQVSGMNAEDTIKLSKELYKTNHPKNQNFTFEPCFWILKDCPRFSNPVDEMAKGKAKKRTSSTGTVLVDATMPTPEVLSNSDEEPPHDLEEGFESAPSSINGKRPRGNRKAKEELKRSKVHDDALKMSALAQQDMATANLQQNKIAENNSGMVLLSLPIEKMHPKLQQFMQDWKLEEAMRLKEQMKVRITNKTESTPAPLASVPRQPIIDVVQPMVEAVQPSMIEELSEEEPGEEDLAQLHELQERMYREKFEAEMNGTN